VEGPSPASSSSFRHSQDHVTSSRLSQAGSIAFWSLLHYTLADSTIRVPIYIRVFFLVGQHALFHYRSRKVRRPRDLQRIAREMNRRVMCNLNWIFSRYRLFPVTSSDNAWQPCVRVLVDRADAVLMEISTPSPSLLWELSLLQSVNVFRRPFCL
jgi:hypothetical protein